MEGFGTHNNHSNHPLLTILNGALYIINHVFAAILLISEEQYRLIQLLFTCGGILVSNTLIVIINWKTIKEWFANRKNSS